MSMRLLKRLDVEAITALSRSMIYALMARGDFPHPIRTGPRAVRWIEAEIQDWITRPPAGGVRPIRCLTPWA